MLERIVQKLKRKASKLLSSLTSDKFKLFDYVISRNPYSNSSHSQILLIKDNRSFSSSNDILSIDWLDKYKLHYQRNDLRASFTFENNDLLEYSIIYCLYYAVSKLKDAELPITFLDIGANYGTFSAPIVEMKVPTILVEPNPFVVSCLRKTFPESEVLEYALIHQDFEYQTIPLTLLPFSSGGSSVETQRLNTDNKHNNFSFTFDANVLRPSSLLDKINANTIPIFKIDIEGNEPSLFRSGLLDKIQSKFDEFILLIEFYRPYLSEEDQLYILNLMSEFYSFVLCPEYLRKSTSLDPQIDFRQNYFNKNEPLEIYEVDTVTGIHALRKNLRGVNSADILIFSSLQLAKASGFI